ncbi:glycosyltransferase [Neorhodopirellula lusitana]
MNHHRRRVLLMASSMRGGGSEHQVALLAEHLPRNQFVVHLYLTHPVGELLDRIPADVKIYSPPPESRPLITRVLNRWPGRVLRNHARFLDELVQRENIDVVYDRTFHNTLIAGHPSIRSQFRRVSTIVSPPDVALPMVERKFVELKRRRLANAYQRSNTVIAVSAAVADSAASYYHLNRQQIQVVFNPVDIAAIRAQAQQSRAKQQHPEQTAAAPNRLRLVCVGRMTPEKGQTDLIAAIGLAANDWPDDAPKLTIQFIGDGPDRANLESAAAALTGSDNTIGGHHIEFAGVVSPATPSIAEADGLVLTSHFEGMPNVVLEAFALNTPVVATQAGGTVELQADADHPTCFWAATNNPSSLADALRRFASDESGRSARITTAQAWVTERHGIDAAVQQIAVLLTPSPHKPIP